MFLLLLTVYTYAAFFSWMFASWETYGSILHVYNLIFAVKLSKKEEEEEEENTF